MNWYKKHMPCVKDIAAELPSVAAEIKQIAGVKEVLAIGSYVEYRDNPNYVLKDVDLIARTEFDSGDLMAVEDGSTAFLMRPDELEDYGFNPKAVRFTKAFLGVKRCNVDHWVISSDEKLLHWGAIPDTHEEWSEIHKEAEATATRKTGVDRKGLRVADEDGRRAWKKAYDMHLRKFVSKNVSGWFPSESSTDLLLERAIKLA
jgi:hypothetical protein